MKESTLKEIKDQISGMELIDILHFISEKFKNQVVFTTSFGIEDQVVTDMIFTNNIDIKIVSLDTGRLFEQTYKVFEATRDKYKKEIEIFFPDTQAVQKLLSTKGPYSFYKSVEDRKECCYIRKVEPLQRILSGNKCWITGIRAEQSLNRNSMDIIDFDENYNLYKLNPLYNRTMTEVIEYLNKNNVPYNSLHHKGYISIGCEPCTRAVKQGEDFRAGRWWWENNSGKECGLHNN